MKTDHFTFAIRKSDRRCVSAHEVRRGLKCECICMECERPLVARQGEVLPAHFAHYHNPGDGGYAPCAATAESILHLAAKRALQEICAVWVPPTPISKRMFVEFEAIHVEPIDRTLEGFRPDLVGRIANGRRLAIEVFVTHAVDERKRERIRAAGISCIEIDVSGAARLPRFEDLKDALARGRYPTTWVYNTREDEFARIESEARRREEAKQRQAEQRERAERMRSARRLQVIHRHSGRGLLLLHVDACPLGPRTFHGQTYAAAKTDCPQCRWYIDRSPTHGHNIHAVFCSAPQADKIINGEPVNEKLRSWLTNVVGLKPDNESTST